MRDNIRIGRIAGVPVSMNWSVLIVLWLLTWTLAGALLPHGAPGHSPGAYWAAGLATAMVLFGSLLAHELAHAVVARRSGVEVEGITLWLFGGIARLGGEPATPGDDFRIAAVGPATSLGLAAAFGVTALTLSTLGAAHLLVSVTGWLSSTNLLLGGFNLLPGAPLDGGRLLRAFLWHRGGDRVQAALTATRAGQTLAYGLMGLGIAELVAGAGGGLWTAFVGWFLLNAARAEEADTIARGALTGMRVADIMTPDPQVGPAWLPVDAFVEAYVLGHPHSAYPLQAPNGRVVGLVTLACLRSVPPSLRSTTPVAAVALGLNDIPRASPEEPVATLLERLPPGDRALVFDGGRLVGIVTPTDITRWIAIRDVVRPALPLERRPAAHP